MSQKDTDEKKLEKIRQLLDDPASSHTKGDKYLSTLQHRLQQTYRPPPASFDASDTTDLKPRVVIHRRKEIVPSSKVTSVTTKNNAEEEQIRHQLDDHELFEIEPPQAPDIPEFVEVKPKEKDESIESDKEQEDELPEWSTIDSEESGIDEEVEKTLELKKDEQPSENEVSVRPPEKPVESETWTEDESDIKPEPAKQTNSVWEPIKKEETTPEPSEPKKESIEEMEFIIMNESKAEPKQSKQKEPAAIQSENKNIVAKQQELDAKKNDEVCSFRDYTLYKKEIKITKDKEKTIHFFSKEPPEEGKAVPLPKGYIVTINKKTGVPYIKEKE